MAYKHKLLETALSKKKGYIYPWYPLPLTHFLWTRTYSNYRWRSWINIFLLGNGYGNNEFLPTQSKLSQDISLMLYISKRKFSSMSFINLMWKFHMRLSFITPVINTCIIPELLGPHGKSWFSWPAPCNRKNSTSSALSNLPLERDPMQIVKRGFFKLGLIYALCQALAENTKADIHDS